MQYLDCPLCQARFHTGSGCQRQNQCPRCGTPFDWSRPSVLARIQARLRRTGAQELPDWETITGAQYEERSHVARTSEPAPAAEVIQPEPRRAGGASDNGGAPGEAKAPAARAA